jgi:hypothetical protein
MDRERKTLAEFSSDYLKSLETPVIIEIPVDAVTPELRFAVRVALGMRRSAQDRERGDR